MCDGGVFVAGFGVVPSSNHGHSSLDVSRAMRAMWAMWAMVKTTYRSPKTPFHGALKHVVLTKGIHYPSRLGSPCAYDSPGAPL